MNNAKPVIVRTVKVRSVRGRLADNGEDMPAPRGGGVRAAPLGGQQQQQSPPPYAHQDPESEEEEDIAVPEADPMAATMVMPGMYNMSGEPVQQQPQPQPQFQQQGPYQVQQQQVQHQDQYNVQYEQEPEPYMGGASAAAASASVGSYSYNPGQDPAPPADHISYITQDTASKQSAQSPSSSGGNGSKKMIWIAIAVLAVVLIGGAVGIAVALSGGSDDPSPVEGTDVNRGINGGTNTPAPTIMTIAESPAPTSLTIAETLAPTTSPSSAPTEEACPEELGEWRTCVNGLTSFDRSFCTQCVVDIIDRCWILQRFYRTVL